MKIMTLELVEALPLRNADAVINSVPIIIMANPMVKRRRSFFGVGCSASVWFSGSACISFHLNSK